jgi:periplasmic protein TonB
VSRAGDAIALALSALLHAALFGAALLVAWQDDIRPATILLVDLIGHAPEPRPVDPPRPAPPRPTPVPPVARQIRPPEDVPAPPRPEAPPEMREPRAAPPPRSPEQPALETVASDAAPAAQPSGPSRVSDTDAAAAGVAVPSASGEPPITARAPAAPGTTSGPSVAAVPAPSAPEQITQTARRRGGYQVPAYPMAARQVGAEGTTLLRVHVSTDGSVDEVQVQRSAGHPALDRAATEAVRKWRFEPARNGSVAVAVWVVVPFEFRLKKDF